MCPNMSMNLNFAGRRLGARVAVEEIGVLDLFVDSFQMEFCIGNGRKSFFAQLAEEVFQVFVRFQMTREIILPSVFPHFCYAAGVASHKRRIQNNIARHFNAP